MTAATGVDRAPAELLTDESTVLPLSTQENFSVAARLLGRAARAHLLAIYGFARLADQVGDEAPSNQTTADRLALLDRLEQELHRAFDGEPEHPLLRRLAPSVHTLGLPREPFLRLIEANRRDQEQAVYETFDQLLAYCELSANPVGELVLHVFAAATPERIALSDRVCTGLQLIEHWQDVAEDFSRGRVYLPAEDLDRFGVAPADLVASDKVSLAGSGPRTGEALRRLLAFEVGRARELLDEGAPLVGTLRGRGRFAVAGYVGGGRANADAIVAAGYDVLAGPPKASGARRVRATLRTWRMGR